MLKRKKKGLGLEAKTFQGKDGNSYLVFRSLDGSYHAFVEVEAKQAARECGAPEGPNTRKMWERLWEKR
ncbi:MAG TPA: hypothetical protein VFX97_11950 [Pyrinomonadaceae bacterium]|nr:hypothetical protein [Pyrinomonadaceae bacterium]